MPEFHAARPIISFYLMILAFSIIEVNRLKPHRGAINGDKWKQTMARQIAIFSDVHANLPALKAVLSDIEARNITEMYCLGDLVDFAPWPNEVIDIIRERHI